MLMRGLLLLLAAALWSVLTAASGCSGAGTARTGSTLNPVKATPVPTTAVDASNAMFATVNAARSVHVRGTYRWPGSRLRVNLGVQMSGQMEGSMVDDSEPISVIDVGGKMYAELTPAFLASLGKSGECPALCGKYVIANRARAASLRRSIGGLAMVNTLVGMGQSRSGLTPTTYRGQHAYRWAPIGYPRGSYLIVSATPQCYPLKAADPGHFVLTFSRWNSVPAPVAPPKSKIFTGTW